MITGFICKGIGCKGEIVYTSLLKVELLGREHDEVFKLISEYHLCPSCAEALTFTYNSQSDFKIITSDWKNVEKHRVSRMGGRG